METTVKDQFYDEWSEFIPQTQKSTESYCIFKDVTISITFPEP